MLFADDRDINFVTSEWVENNLVISLDDTSFVGKDLFPFCFVKFARTPVKDLKFEGIRELWRRRRGGGAIRIFFPDLGDFRRSTGTVNCKQQRIV